MTSKKIKKKSTYLISIRDYNVYKSPLVSKGIIVTKGSYKNFLPIVEFYLTNTDINIIYD